MRLVSLSRLACLVLGCVRVCLLPQRLSKGKCIGSILEDRGRLRDAFYLIDKDPPRSGSAVLGRCSPAIPQPGARAIPIVDRGRVRAGSFALTEARTPDLGHVPPGGHHADGGAVHGR